MLKCPFSSLRAIQKVNSVGTRWCNFPKFEVKVLPILTVFEEIKEKAKMTHKGVCPALKDAKQSRVVLPFAMIQTCGCSRNTQRIGANVTAKRCFVWM